MIRSIKKNAILKAPNVFIKHRTMLQQWSRTKVLRKLMGAPNTAGVLGKRITKPAIDYKSALEVLGRNAERAKYAKRKRHGLIYVYESQLLRAKIYSEQAELAFSAEEKTELLKKAYEDLEDIRRRSPPLVTAVSVKAQFDLGNVYFQMKRYGKAAEQFETAITYVPSGVYQALSSDELKTSFEKYIRKKYVEAHRLIGVSLLMAEVPQFEKARERLEKYWNLFETEYPEFRKSKELMGRASKTFEYMGDSYAYEAEGIVQANRNSKLRLAEKEFQKAISHYQHVASLPYLNEKMSLVLTDQNEGPRAAIYFQRAIDSWSQLETTHPENAKNYRRIREEMERIKKIKKRVGPARYKDLMRSQEQWKQRIRPIN